MVSYRKKRVKTRPYPKCKSCVYYTLLSKPGRDVTCSELGRKPNMNACTKYINRKALTCSDCILFLYRTCPFGKNDPLGKICTSFKHKDLLKNVNISRVKNPIDKSLDSVMQEAFVRIMSHVFSFEKAAHSSVDKLVKELDKHDVAVPFNTASYERVVSRISKFFVINQLAQVCGVGHMSDKIIKHEMELERITAANRASQVNR